MQTPNLGYIFSIRKPPRSWNGHLAALFLAALFVVVSTLWSSGLCFAARGGELLLRVMDADTKAPLAVRIHLKNSAAPEVHRFFDQDSHGFLTPTISLPIPSLP